MEMPLGPTVHVQLRGWERRARATEDHQTSGLRDAPWFRSATLTYGV